NYGINPGFPTYAGGVNSDYWVAGHYIDGANYRAFVWKGFNDYDTIRYPGQNRTRFTGMNNNGYIVGNAGFGNQIGFIVSYDGSDFGEFLDIEILGASQIWPQHINEKNEVSGYYLDADGKAHGFLMLADMAIDFDPLYDSYAFVNEAPPFWQPNMYSDINYAYDPYLMQQGIASEFPRFANGDVIESSTWPRWDYFVEAYGPDNFYTEVLGQPQLVRRKMRTWFGNRDTSFSGVCYGMTSTAAAFKFRREMLNDRFPVFAGMQNEILWNNTLSLTPELEKAISMMQLYCWGRPYGYNKIQYQYDLAEGSAGRIFSNMFHHASNPLLLILERKWSPGNEPIRGAHALLPYRIQLVEDYNYLVSCYDPNYPGDTSIKVGINKYGDFDGLAVWAFNAEGGEPVYNPNADWNAGNADGIYVSGPLENTFFQPFVFSPVEDESGPLAVQRDVENLSLIFDTDVEFALTSNSNPGDTLGLWNGRTLSSAGFGTSGTNPNFYPVPMRSAFFTPENYSLKMQNCSSSEYSVSLSDLNVNTIYFFDRHQVNSSDEDDFIVNDGLTFINNETGNKSFSAGILVETSNGETIEYVVNNLTAAQGESLSISVVNEYMLEVNNGNDDQNYTVEITYMNASEMIQFEHDNIQFSAGATHIISPFPPSGGEFEPSIFVDEGQNGSFEDTLFIDNLIPAQMHVAAEMVQIENTGGSQSVLVTNLGGGELNWTASASEEWINLTQSSGTNTGLVSFNVNANPNLSQDRTGFIYVTGNGQSDTIAVIQGDFSLFTTQIIDDETGLKLFPNPADDLVNISFNRDLKINAIEVFDITGRKMNTLVFSSPGQQAVVMVNQLPSGVYFINITAEGRLYTSKFIKK
ncbi:MAG: T9SS type A sorting domain-containing protein, partial [Bacteroidetes bacterium]|nr:T9SS type A sorting domain-containing protein [Bacteroidota bacterium]